MFWLPSYGTPHSGPPQKTRGSKTNHFQWQFGQQKFSRILRRILCKSQDVTFLHFCCSYFRTRILLKSGDDKIACLNLWCHVSWFFLGIHYKSWNRIKNGMTSHIRLLMKILVRESEKEVQQQKGWIWHLIVFLMFNGDDVAINT